MPNNPENWEGFVPSNHDPKTLEQRLERLEEFFHAIAQDSTLSSLFTRGLQVGRGLPLFRLPNNISAVWIQQDAGGPATPTNFVRIGGTAGSVPTFQAQAQSAAGVIGDLTITDDSVSLGITASSTITGLSIVKGGPLDITLRRESINVVLIDSTSLRLTDPSGDVRIEIPENHVYLGNQSATKVDVDTNGNEISLTALAGTTTKLAVQSTGVVITDVGSAVTIASFTRNPTTSQDTAMALRYHNGTAQFTAIVSVGAADSGGAGFRLLRVPNN